MDNDEQNHHFAEVFILGAPAACIRILVVNDKSLQISKYLDSLFSLTRTRDKVE